LRLSNQFKFSYHYILNLLLVSFCYTKVSSVFIPFCGRLEAPIK